MKCVLVVDNCDVLGDSVVILNVESVYIILLVEEKEEVGVFEVVEYPADVDVSLFVE